MSTARRWRTAWVDPAVLVVGSLLYIAPFVFIVLTASKTPAEASLFQFTLPEKFLLFNNISEVVTFDNGRMLLALFNSTLITLLSVVFTVLFAALIAVALQRRSGRIASLVASLMLGGLIIPPAVVPTIFVLQKLLLFKSLAGMIFVNIALNMPFAILIFRTFMGTIPRELDEATIVDGATPLRLFWSVLLPLLQPAILTVVVTSTVNIFNDFVGPLYFLPGARNVTAPLTLFNFIGQFGSRWNLVFADVLVVAVIPFIVFVFFQRQLVSGITGGAIKG